MSPADIVQAAILVVIVLTLRVYHLQLKEMKRSANGQNLLAVIEFIQNSDVREARKAVLGELHRKDLFLWDDADKRAASLVCSTYDVAGIMIRQDVIDKKPIVENWGRSIRRCHEILTPYMDNMREELEVGGDYWDDFDWLAEEAKTPGSSESV